MSQPSYGKNVQVYNYLILHRDNLDKKKKKDYTKCNTSLTFTLMLLCVSHHSQRRNVYPSVTQDQSQHINSPYEISLKK